MSDMQGQFDWSESGLTLLQHIQRVIEENGGNERMYLKIIEETSENKYKRRQSRLSDNIRTLRRSNVKHQVIIDVLGISKAEFDKIYREQLLEE